MNLIPNRDSLMNELIEWGALPCEVVRQRWEAEEAQLGVNVCRDVLEFGVVPHQYDQAMELLYKEGLGFIFETLVYWINPDRQAWSHRALDRLNLFCRERRLEPQELRILMLGDGAGSDSLLLASHGYHPDYFDVPDSRTSDFVRFRIKKRDLCDKVTAVNEYRNLLNADYHAVWCFDVFEHLPDLPAAIQDMGRMLVVEGIALITESCRYVRPDLPTHLLVNAPFHQRIPALMRKAGLCINYCAKNTDYRPIEYRKLPDRYVFRRLRSLFLQWCIDRKRIRDALIRE